MRATIDTSSVLDSIVVSIKYRYSYLYIRLHLHVQVIKKFPTLPFTLRAMDDERAAKMGIKECVNHELLLPYPVLYEKPGDQIAHVKFTILLLAGGTIKITGLPLPEGMFRSSEGKALPEDLAAILAAEPAKKRRNKKKSKKNKGGAGANAGNTSGGKNEAEEEDDDEDA